MSFSNQAHAVLNRPAPPIRALLLDDDRHDRRRIRRFSQKSQTPMQIDEAPTISAMSNMVDEEAFDVIMVDYHLAEGNGLEALDVIQKSSSNKDTAVIMISGNQQSRVAAAAFRQGCSDFISKEDLSPIVLHDAVTSAIGKVPAVRQTEGAVLVPGLEGDVRLALQAALESAATQSMIMDAIQRAASSIDQAAGNTTSQTLEDLLAEFMHVDEFHFRN